MYNRDGCKSSHPLIIKHLILVWGLRQMRYDKYGNKKNTLYYMKIVIAIILVLMLTLGTVAAILL
jgi:hypothetical protein